MIGFLLFINRSHIPYVALDGVPLIILAMLITVARNQ